MSDAFASTSPDTRRSHGTFNSSMPSSARYSMSSFHTGESSKQGSRLHPPSVDHEDIEHDAPLAEGVRRSVRGSHRSHRSRNSGGFLLADSSFYDGAPVEDTAAQSTPRKRDSHKEDKGKGIARGTGSLHVRKKPSMGLGITTSSPLSRHVRNAERTPDGAAMGGDGAQDKKPSVQKGMDIDSANIVNLALNLSESRRQAGRRIVSSPLPPAVPTFEDNLAGPNLRQHLQAQRRISRNMSPKPDKGGFGIARQPTERISSPLLQSALDGDGQSHQYEFSQATLERAQKAREAIELMAQYRRLLQYLPPLKPTTISRQTTLSPPSTSAGSPTAANFKDREMMSGPARQLGRPYNPLQYIRNRKVRARERQMLDGVAEGFGDVQVVTAWVDRIADDAETAGYELSDVIKLPPLMPNDPNVTSLFGAASPELVAVKPGLLAFKPKRPKNDWIISGPDMLADVVWLEQNENKKLIEDNRERKIFPARATLIRMNTDRSDDYYPRAKSMDKDESKTQKFAPLKLNTNMPIFKPMRKSGLRRKSRSRSRSGSPERRGRHNHLSSSAKKHSLPTDDHLSKGQMSDSGTDGSEKPMFASLRRKRPRAGTADSFQSTQSYDMGRDVLQKQMTELLKKEQRNGAPERPEVRRILSAMETHSPAPMDLESASDSGPSKAPTREAPTRAGSRPTRSGSLNLDQRPAGSGRPSLEVPGHRPRMSLGGAGSDFDSTAPNSPEHKAKRLSTFIPNLNIDLSSPPSRKHSPHRKPALQRVRSKIKHLRSRSAEPDSKDSKDSKDDSRRDDLRVTIPDTPPKAARSPSPSKRFQRHQKRLTTDEIDSPTVSALIAPRAKDELLPRKIRSRNPLNRVGDMLWRRGNKDSSSSSEDEDEDAAEDSVTEDRDEDRRDSLGVTASKSRSKSPRAPLGKSFLDEMPEFKSPFDRKDRARGRSPNPVGGNDLSPMGTRTSPPKAPYQAPEQGDLREERERKERLRPPRIEIDRASNSNTPDPDDHRGSTATYKSEMSSLSRVLSADSRLNQMLGIPGYSGREKDFFLPVTGLAHIDHDRSHSKSRDDWGGKLKAAEEIKVSRKEIARIRAILLSTGIKAKEIARRPDEIHPLDAGHTRSAFPRLTHQSEELARLPLSEQFLAAGQLIDAETRVHHSLWQNSAQTFIRDSVPTLLQRMDTMKIDLDDLATRVQNTADEAEVLNSDVHTRQTEKAKALGEALETMIRKRKRRFRWARRAWWFAVEWALVGVMWWYWLVFVIVRIAGGFVGGIFGVVRWLLWL